MKKFNILIASVAILAFTTSSFAQQIIDISGGAVTKSYSVAATGGSTISSYTWAVSGGASGFASSGTTSQSITWNGAINTYTLSVTPISNNSCAGAPQTLSVQLVNALPITVAWNSASLSECPYEATSNPTGGDVAGQLNLSAAPIAASWTVYYTVDGGAETSSSVSGQNAAFAYNSDYTNASATTNATHTVAVTRYVVDGTEYVPASTIDLTVTVYPTPTITTITAN